MNSCKDRKNSIIYNELFKIQKFVSLAKDLILRLENKQCLISAINHNKTKKCCNLSTHLKNCQCEISNIRKERYLGTIFYFRNIFIFIFTLFPLVESLKPKPPVLNLKKYVIAYNNLENQSKNIRDFMKENNLKFYEVSILANSDVREYLLKEYKSLETRIWYYGEPLGNFKDFKKRINSFKKSQEISFKKKHKVTEYLG